MQILRLHLVLRNQKLWGSGLALCFCKRSSLRTEDFTYVEHVENGGTKGQGALCVLSGFSLHDKSAFPPHVPLESLI